MSTLGVVLAAGGGRRFGGDKLRAPFRGRPLVAWAVDAAREAGLAEVAIVVGARDLGDVLPDDVTVLANERWQEGQASSVAVAVAHAGAAGHDAVVIGLGDSPLVDAEAWRLVAAAEGAVVTAEFDGARRPPVRLDRSVWPLLPTTGDEGARALMRERPDLVTAVPCPGDPLDVDTRGDLDRWS